MSASRYTDCPVIHEDHCVLVINKPPGVLSHPNPHGGSESCAFLGRYDHEEHVFSTPAGPLWLIHRIDQDTSGVLLAAKTRDDAQKCRTAFEDYAVKKFYLALTVGTGWRNKGQWQDHLAVARQGSRVRTEVIRGRKPNAEARYRLVQTFATDRMSLIEVELITGKTHQIRVQSAARQQPIAGDDVYGSFDINRRLRKELGIRRLCLHAWRLELPHPETGRTLAITAPVADDMLGVLHKLGYQG